MLPFSLGFIFEFSIWNIEIVKYFLTFHGAQQFRDIFEHCVEILIAHNQKNGSVDVTEECTYINRRKKNPII